MAVESVQLSAAVGVGELAAVDELSTGEMVQGVKLLLGADGVDGGWVSTSNPLPVDVQSSAIQVDDAAFIPGTGEIVILGAIMDDTAPDSVDEGDGGALRMSSRRALHTELRDGAGNERSLNVTANGEIGVDAIRNALPTGNNNIGDVDVASLPGTVATDITAIKTAVEILDNVVSGSEAQVDIVAALPAGTNNIGDVDVLTVPADPFGANADAAATAGSTGSIQAKLRLMTSQLDAIKTAVETLDNAISGNEIQADVLTLPGIAGDVAHGTADSGNPIKVGAKAAVSALPTAEANGDRVNLITDRYGRNLSGAFDIGMYKHEAASYTASQTGTVLVDPTSGTLIIITHLTIGTSGTSAGRVTIWYGANADSTYTEGTDRCIFDGTLTPSASATPGVVMAGQCFLPAAAANDEIHVTTTGDVDVNISVWYVEVTP